jgi:hypothetical protein
MGKYSDYLPRFGRNQFRDDDEGAARFEHFIDDARVRRQKPKSRPALKVVLLAIVLMGMGWSLKERNTLVAFLRGKRARHRTIVPMAIPMGADGLPEYSPALLKQRIEEVTPRAQACLLAYPGLQRDQTGRVDVEVVLSHGGAVEAAVYGQPELPEPVARCVGEALGSRVWPQPPWLRKLRFSVVGGSL